MKKNNWFVAGGLGLVAAVIYFASVAGYAFPGDGAHLMACWRGLTVDSVPQYPLMAFFARLLGGGNLIAPVCGVIAVVTLFHLVAAFVSGRAKGEETGQHRESLSLVAATTAAVVFLLTPAVRSAATHLEPRMFDFAWAMLAMAVSLPFLRLPKGVSWLNPIFMGAMVGVGLVDSAVFLVLMPLYLAIVWKVARRHGRKPYLPLFLFVLFVVASALAAVVVMELDLSESLKQLAEGLKGYLSVPGWLFVTVFSTLPFVTVLFSSARAFRDKPGLVQWIFHSALSFVSILAVATPLSPTALMEPYAILPVATSACTAVVAGCLVAYWWFYRRSVVALIAGGALAFVIAVSLAWNLFTFDGDAGAFADKVAEKAIEDLGDRSWLVTDGVLDDHLLLVAAEKGKKLNLVSLVRDQDADYLARLGETVKREGIGGSRNSALSLSLSLGVLAFVEDWFSSDPTAAKEAAVWGAPDLWYNADVAPVPEFLFFGGDKARTPDWNVWKQFDAILKAPKGWGSYHREKISNPVDRLRLSLRRHIGFVANNRGVYLQDAGKDDDAFSMYELVLNEIDHDNICAIFNEVGLIGQNHPKATAKKHELERMLKSAVEDKNRRYLLWRLGTYYGYIRNPEMFVRIGHAWARSGRPGDALSQIRRAIDFVPTDKRGLLLNMMAALYANEDDQQKSRRIYKSLLEKDAKDHDALIGMMQLSLKEGNASEALEYLQRASEVAGDERRGRMEKALAALLKNDFPQAKELVRKMTDANHGDMQAWSLQAAIVMQQIDSTPDAKAKAALQKELDGEILPRMEKGATSQFDYYLQSTRGFNLLRQGEHKRKEARDAFISASKTRPDISATQDMVLGLDISLDDKANAEEHAKQVLRRNRKAPLANYVMGSIALGRGQDEAAEMYLRVAAEAPQPVVLALNDLAEVLRRNRKFDDAERYARLATEKAPGLYIAWETLGSVLMDAGKNLDEAEACVRKACQLSKDASGKEADVRMLISLARVQIARKDMIHAKVTVRKVRAHLDELSDFEKREFEKVAEGVK